MQDFENGILVDCVLRLPVVLLMRPNNGGTSVRVGPLDPTIHRRVGYAEEAGYLADRNSVSISEKCNSSVTILERLSVNAVE